MTRRFRELGTEIRKAIVDLDVLGLRDREGAVNVLPDPADFVHRRDLGKIDAFMRWLQQEEARGVLQVTYGPTGPQPWTNTYVQSAYQSGLRDAHTKLGAAGGAIDIPGTTQIAGGFYTPFHVDRAALMYTKVFTDLEGVTVTMNNSMRRIMTQGMIEGIGPEEMARRLVSGVVNPATGRKGVLHSIGINRARLIARTSMVETHNMAALAEYDRASAVTGRTIYSQWMTARDERVRGRPGGLYPRAIPSHWAREGKVYPTGEAAALLGEPNCRCALKPYIPGVSPSLPANKWGGKGPIPADLRS
jgi:hypothetical protein